MMKLALAAMILVGFSICADAGSINGMTQSAVCDPTTNQGKNCAKPNAEGTMVVADTGIFNAATVGTSSGLVVPLGASTTYLLFYNPSAPGGNTVYCRETAAAVTNGAGTIGLAPGQSFTMESSLVDGGAWNCIATGAGTPFTYGAK